jgi:hypothetical protein
VTNELFVLTLAAGLGVMFRWGFKSLPQEKWQIMVCVPTARDENRVWNGHNFTYYGFFVSLAVVVSVGITFVLISSLGVPRLMTLSTIGLTLAFCVSAARFVAGIVEGKQHTFTVAGASFAGMLIAPLAVWAVNRIVGVYLGSSLPLLPTLASLGVGYAFGEGMGRLACISFGCCYGKPLAECGPLCRKIFGPRCFVFEGETKKVSYEGILEGQPLVPVQGLTALVSTGIGLLGTIFFLNGYYAAAFTLSIVLTQAWRFFSETLRADYRGGGRISAYQIMALIGMLYSGVIAWVIPGQHFSPPELRQGAAALWRPEVILLLQALGIAVFLYTGRSTVTASKIAFLLHRDRI